MQEENDEGVTNFVADEVRNLAMRAADAARNTATLIEGTVKKVKEGSQLVEKTNEDFTRVSDIVVKSGGLVGEIAAAPQEQVQGIEQVNKAVSEMDTVTQQELVILVGGSGKVEGHELPPEKLLPLDGEL